MTDKFRPAIEQQPTPIRRDDVPAAWDLVIEFTKNSTPDYLIRVGAVSTNDVHRENVLKSLLLEDMADRRQFGLSKYGVLLAGDNGRNNLVDAYQESLDLLVYLANELYDRGLMAGLQHNDSESDQSDPVAVLFLQTFRVAKAICKLLHKAAIQ